MEYTNEFGLVSKPLLREIADAVRKKTGKTTSIQTTRIPDEIKKIKGECTTIVTSDSVNVRMNCKNIKVTHSTFEPSFEIYKTTTTYFTSTSATVSLNTKPGSLVLAILAPRSKITVPSGWNVLYESEKTSSDFATYDSEVSSPSNQKILVLSTIATSTTTQCSLVKEGSSETKVILVGLSYFTELELFSSGGGALDDSGYTSSISTPEGNSFVIYTCAWANSNNITYTPNPNTLQQVNYRLAFGYYNSKQEVQARSPIDNCQGNGYLYVVLKEKD